VQGQCAVGIARSRGRLIVLTMKWRLIVDAPHASPEAAVAVDEALLTHVAQQPALRLWVNAPCVVLGRLEAHLAGLSQALDAFARTRVPIVQRTSGGTAIWHGPGVFNVSVIVPEPMIPPGVHQTFEALGKGMIRGLGRLGLEARFGRVPGTYCDGPHNLVIGGKKVAGLAQVRRKRGALVHASVLVSADLQAMHERLEEFYAAAGQPHTFNRAGVTTLEDLGHRAIGFDEFVHALSSGYQPEGDRLRQDHLSADEARWLREHQESFLLSKPA